MPNWLLPLKTRVSSQHYVRVDTVLQSRTRTMTVIHTKSRPRIKTTLFYRSKLKTFVRTRN